VTVTAFASVLMASAIVGAGLAVRATRAEKKAKSESSKSRQVAQFLKDMLDGVGPSVALGRDTQCCGKFWTRPPSVSAAT